ncbi:hydroxymethylpyrimidine pyrophosphatase-like HAD family hydrolase [Rathayibacter sp. PhB93]|nr:hydroxymethylpyrimidine pyrophosphatase-like HAD family hydrolase [Rathayibacter sp. PhB93]ROQ56063.1 hydroxymethylpyrimidine pyrophosphatase-like HAD family hydrolase [Rathayibacter sp. PhB152]TDQ07968.1 hydroxymethylpyrimidine pyrophosphatase-like HAD family hydrolase [Rathayibacter sp. PhB1]
METMTSTPPPLGLLLDVDGPIASPISRTIAIDSIADDLVALANAGIPLVFNTGRSDAFLRERVLPPLLERGVSADARIVCVCEKGAVWFTVDYRGTSEPIVDESLAIPEAVARDLERMIREDYDDLVFFDETKRAMVSAEQLVDLSSEDYLERQLVFDADALQIMTAAGLGVERRGIRYPNDTGAVEYRIDPTVISTDIESNRLGKDLGAQRAVELLGATGPIPQRWRTVGDSRSDYAMADWLSEHAYDVAHVDVRPAEGVPDKPYPILVVDGAINDEAGAAVLRRWTELVADETTPEVGDGISLHVAD